LVFVILKLPVREGKDAPYYKNQPSDHFNGETFFNPNEMQAQGKSPLSYFKSKRLFEKEHGKPKWQKDLIQSKATKPASAIDNGSITATYVGHSTFLLQLQGLNILTDPIWSTRASPFSFIGPKRIKTPGVNFEDLPKIDAVLISHSHYDHMDIPTIERLRDSFNPKFLVGLGNCHFLNNISKLGIDCTEMDWGDKFNLQNHLVINFLPAKHWSKRAFLGSNATLWGAFAIESDLGGIYFAGDTGYGTHFAEAKKDFGDFTLALLPIGAYKPSNFMAKSHISPKEAIQAHFDLGAKHSIAMHYETFQLASDDFLDPRREIENFKRQKLIGDEFSLLEVGETLRIKKNSQKAKNAS